MTSIETFDLLISDIDKTANTLLSVRTIAEIHAERLVPGYVYNQEPHLHEYWIALGHYSFWGNLARLVFLINDRQMLLPNLLPSSITTRKEMVEFIQLFKANKSNVVAAFDNIIGHPNRLFPYSFMSVSKEDMLIKIVGDIHEETLNLGYNFEQLKAKQVMAQN